MKKTLTTTILCALALAACSTQTPPPKQAQKGGSTSTPAPTSAIAWAPCTDVQGPDGKTINDPGMECAKLPVPLDYAAQGGQKIDLALVRIKATGTKQGSLVFNFGGPGGSGIDTLPLAKALFAGLNSSYDLVSFDPRGVDRSAPVKCGDTEKYVSESFEDDDKMAEQFVADCQKDSAKVLPHLGTVNAAQDLEQIRVAVGDDKLNYFGISYGTHLGAVYATKYPEKVGRFVLDAALDPTVTFEERAIAQTKGFKQAFEAFEKDCAARACKLGGDVESAVDKLIDKLETKPLKVKDRELTADLASTGIFAALYAKQTWPLLEQGVTAAQQGDGTMLLLLADSYTGRKPDGTYSTMMASMPAISCLDSSERPDEASVDRVEQATEKIFPLVASGGLGSICRHWPAKGSDEAKRIDATGSAPIVVVGGKGDPATPYEWAPKLVAQLKTGVLLTYEGEGHGAYLSGSSCVTRAIDAYLLKGEVPQQNATCPAS
ncbi:alpha/beta fold hydrolase [Nonomuraea sp. NPDC050663]|uniref:alpha/beta fold hydrolase n=1 Tax=Nonomuraea sp. NPDC050663 TaxID=3364370 RepID=UPI0037B5904E